MKAFCENQYCQNPGFKEVSVSADAPSDGKRTLCAACEEVFTWGVQHGAMSSLACAARPRGLPEKGDCHA
jgi:hypothetical protein